MLRRLIIIAIVAMPAIVSSVCAAHPAQLVAATMNVGSAGEFQIRVRLDLLALALNDVPANVDDASMNALLDGANDELARRLVEARERFIRGVHIICGEERASVRADTITFPSVGDVYAWRDAGIKPRLPVMQEVTLAGRLPQPCTSIAVRFPEVLGPVVLTIERPGEEPYSEPLDAGQTSSILPIRFSRFISPSAASAVASSNPGQLHAALKYFALGFHHILPTGPDHMLFVLGLFLLSTRLGPLLWQITAFTAAHSITLALSLYGVIRLSGTIVEPLIALSIAFVAVENLFTSDLKPWRPFVVFGFGLVHGLGFAGALTQMGLPREQFATALITFNGGVEAGQLAVIALAFALVGWWRRHDWYRRAIVFPASSAIAAVALVWTIQRVVAAV